MAIHANFDNHSKVHNFFFHPLNKEDNFWPVVTNVFLTVITCGLWQIPFWIVNRLDHKNIKVLDKDKTPKVNSVSNKVLNDETVIFKTEKSKLAEYLTNKKLSAKIFELPKPIEAPIFKPLSTKSLDLLLKELPELNSLMVAQGHVSAHDSITAIHTVGIPCRIQNQTANNELKTQMQYIIYKISEQKDLNRKHKMLKDLAGCLMDCVPVTQGKVSNMYRKLAFGNQTNFDLQMQAFLDDQLADQKEKAVDATIFELFPEMNEPDYADKNYNYPSKQFPHVKNGFLNKYGKQIGLILAGAEGDSNANASLANKDNGKFLELFNKHFDMKPVIRNFVLKLNGNGRNGDEITNEDFTKWSAETVIGHAAYYDETHVYPDYCKMPDKEQTGLTKAFITEAVAVKVFEKLEYFETIPRVYEQGS